MEDSDLEIAVHPAKRADFSAAYAQRSSQEHQLLIAEFQFRQA